MDAQTLLQELIAKYRYHTDFAELDLTDINQQCYPDDDALLHLVARVGGPDKIALLVASGARVNAPGDMGYTPLHYAAMRGRIEVIQKLLDLGADPLIENEFGETSTNVAENGGHKKSIHLLRVAAKSLRVRKSSK